MVDFCLWGYDEFCIFPVPIAFYLDAAAFLNLISLLALRCTIIRNNFVIKEE